MNRRDLFRRLPLLAVPALPLPAAADGAAAPAGGGGRPDPLLTPEESAFVAKHPVVLYAPDRDYPPFCYVDAQGVPRGLSIDLLDRVAAHTGLRFQAVSGATRPENIERLRRREVDLVTSLRPTPEREKIMAFTGSYVSSPAVVLRRRDDRRGGGLEALGGQRVGVDRASATQQYLSGAAPAAVLVPADSAVDVLRALAFGETDAAVLNLATASWLISRERIVGLRVAGELPWWAALTLGYRRDWPLLGRVLEKGLAQIPEPEREALVRQWVPLADLPWWRRPEVQRVMGVSAVGAGLVLGGLLLWNHALRRAVATQTEALRKELAERHRLEQRLRTLAEHDPLTGLMNRAALTESLRRSLAMAARQRWSVAVVFIDLDGFKQVNDTMGHAAGDELLRQIANRLSGSLRESDLLGRLGGDEFIVVAEALHDPPRNAQDLAAKLLAQVRQPFVIDGRDVRVGFSAGIALHPGDGDTAEALIARADAAMYRAKAAGRHRALLYRDLAPQAVAATTGDPAPGDPPPGGAPAAAPDPSTLPEGSA